MPKKQPDPAEPEAVVVETTTETGPTEALKDAEKTGLALFLSRYRADQSKFPGELRSLIWKASAAGMAVISSKHGTLLWPDGSPAVFPAKEANEIAAYLRPIRPLDQINIQPA